MRGTKKNPSPEIYRINVEGRLGKSWADWLEGMVISYQKNQTVLTGPLPDQAALYGLLHRIRDLNLTLVSVNRKKSREKTDITEKIQNTEAKKLGGKKMKNTIILVSTVLLLAPISSSQDLTGKDIIEKANDLFNAETSYVRSKMTIITTSGQERTFIQESWSKDRGEKNLVRYLEPRRVKDQAVLMLNHADDIWMFFPRTQRVRKLASHAKKQKMQGSDFSYEDMGSGDAFIEDFTSRRLEDEQKKGKDCYKLELTRKPDSDSSYSRLIMLVMKENFLPIVIDYYDENDPTYLQKTMVASNFRVIDDIPTATRVVMFNKNDNTQTEMELLEVKYDIALTDDLFTERSLKK